MVHLDDGRTKVRGREGGRKGRPGGRELWCSIGTTVVPVGAESGLIREVPFAQNSLEAR